MLTHENLREVLHYDPETGLFTWLVARRGVTLGTIAGWIDGYGYWIIEIDGHVYRAHRLAWFYVHGTWPRQIDHKDANRLNNRWDNLRLATHSQNQANVGRSCRNTSGFKGVSWHSRERRWCAQIKINGKSRHLGYFHFPEEAHEAYCKAARELFGEFARAA